MSEQNKKIKCLAYYDTLESNDNRMNSPAAYTKTSYILECFERLGYDVDILSASYVVGNKSAKGKIQKLSDKITLKTLFSMGRGSFVKKVMARILFGISYFFNLLKFVNKGDTVWVYHSIRLMWQVKLLKKLKKFNLILEVEEIYGDVSSSKKMSRKELEYFKCADGYIFCNYLLGEKINRDSKPFAVSHGAYTPADDKEPSFNDGKIHVVYAGTFSLEKGGAYFAVGAAEHLSEKFHMHILGFGTEKQVEDIASLISETDKRSRCKITYDGCLSGDEYYAFLQMCQIGLSTQNPAGEYNDTSFPSKVLVYMANGLRVVSVRIPAIEKSDVGQYMHFYDEPTPEAVAKAIENIDFNSEYNGREIIKELDVEFLKDMDKLLKDIGCC